MAVFISGRAVVMVPIEVEFSATLDIKGRAKPENVMKAIAKGDKKAFVNLDEGMEVVKIIDIAGYNPEDVEAGVGEALNNTDKFKLLSCKVDLV